MVSYSGLCFLLKVERESNPQTLPYHPSLLFRVPFLHTLAVKQIDSEIYLRLCGGNSPFISKELFASLLNLPSCQEIVLLFTWVGWPSTTSARCSISADCTLSSHLPSVLLSDLCPMVTLSPCYLCSARHLLFSWWMGINFTEGIPFFMFPSSITLMMLSPWLLGYVKKQIYLISYFVNANNLHPTIHTNLTNNSY